MSWVIKEYSEGLEKEITEVGKRVFKVLTGQEAKPELAYYVGKKTWELLIGKLPDFTSTRKNILKKYNVVMDEDEKWFHLNVSGPSAELKEVWKYLINKCREEKNLYPYACFIESHEKTGIILAPDIEVVSFEKGKISLLKKIWNTKGSVYGDISRKIIKIFDEIASKFYEIPRP